MLIGKIPFVALVASALPLLAAGSGSSSASHGPAESANEKASAWSFHESFDRDVLSPVYPESVIYGARPRKLRVHTPTIVVGRDRTLILALRDLPAVKNESPLDMDPVNAIHFMTSSDAFISWRQ